MRKQKLITKTFKKTNGKMLLVEVETRTKQTLSFKLIGNYKTKEEVFKAFKNEYDGNTNIIPVQVLEFFTEEKTYGITAETFISNAVELDADSKKPISEVQ